MTQSKRPSQKRHVQYDLFKITTDQVEHLSLLACFLLVFQVKKAVNSIVFGAKFWILPYIEESNLSPLPNPNTNFSTSSTYHSQICYSKLKCHIQFYYSLEKTMA
jgi:hypothetical protein